MEKYAIIIGSLERFINKFSPTNPSTLWRDTLKTVSLIANYSHISCTIYSSELLAQVLSLSTYIHSLSTDHWRAKERQTPLLCSALGIKESQERACQEPSSTLSQLRFSAQRAASQLGHWQQQLHTNCTAQCSLAPSTVILPFSLQSRRHVGILTVFEEHMKYNFCNCS